MKPGRPLDPVTNPGEFILEDGRHVLLPSQNGPGELDAVSYKLWLHDQGLGSVKLPPGVTLPARSAGPSIEDRSADLVGRSRAAVGVMAQTAEGLTPNIIDLAVDKVRDALKGK